VQYLLLEQLGAKDRFIAPDDLKMLRHCVKSAKQVLHCHICPSRYLFVIQTGGILGILSMCIAECYAKIVDAVEQEESRASQANEKKQLCLSSYDPEPLPSESPVETHTSEAIVLETSPSEWRNLIRGVIKPGIFGTMGCKDNCFISWIEGFEDRQRRWYSSPPAPDCPPGYRSACGITDRIPTCLMVVQDVKTLLDIFGL